MAKEDLNEVQTAELSRERCDDETTLAYATADRAEIQQVTHPRENAA
jgi:hypothetical protein